LNYCFSTDIAVIILTPDQSVHIAAMCVCIGDSLIWATTSHR